MGIVRTDGLVENGEKGVVGFRVDGDRHLEDRGIQNAVDETVFVVLVDEMFGDVGVDIGGVGLAVAHGFKGRQAVGNGDDLRFFEFRVFNAVESLGVNYGHASDSPFEIPAGDAGDGEPHVGIGEETCVRRQTAGDSVWGIHHDVDDVRLHPEVFLLIVFGNEKGVGQIKRPHEVLEIVGHDAGKSAVFQNDERIGKGFGRHADFRSTVFYVADKGFFPFGKADGLVLGTQEIGVVELSAPIAFVDVHLGDGVVNFVQKRLIVFSHHDGHVKRGKRGEDLFVVKSAKGISGDGVNVPAGECFEHLGFGAEGFRGVGEVFASGKFREALDAAAAADHADSDAV